MFSPDAPGPRPLGYIAPADRAKQGTPGTYIDVVDGGVSEQDERGAAGATAI